jgi:hypothetical protein
MQAPVSQEYIHSFHPKLRISFKTRLWEGTAHLLFLASVLTVIGVPRRDGPRKSEPGPLMVSVDFQLSVLELVAELLRTAPSFLVIIDQRLSLRGSHRSSVLRRR